MVSITAVSIWMRRMIAVPLTRADDYQNHFESELETTDRRRSSGLLEYPLSITTGPRSICCRYVGYTANER